MGDIYLENKIGVQLARGDAHEQRTRYQAEKEAGREARAVLVERLSHAKALDLREVTRGKYFRLVTEVIADGENMSDLLLELGLARRYDGGKRERTFYAGMVVE